jgi:opacity protein-like surface antigen
MLARSAMVLAFAAASLPAPALAADCPDGWFCDDGQSDGTRPPPVEPPPTEPAPDARPPAEPPPPPPPGYFREPPPPRRIRLMAPEEPPRPRYHRRRKELGFNLHLNAALLGEGAASDAGMAGLGAAFRFRPLPAFAADVGFDFLGGRDYAGNRRSERAFVGNALVFFNPRDLVQVYAIGGFTFSHAWVSVERSGGYAVAPYDTSYTHAGLQLGMGLEWRLARRAALSTDLLYFRRHRTDAGRRDDPEFVDPATGRATNESQGALFRAGVTFYF